MIGRRESFLRPRIIFEHFSRDLVRSRGGGNLIGTLGGVSNRQESRKESHHLAAPTAAR